MALARARTKDKWRLVLQETEQKAAVIANHVAALEEEKARLRRRADMLSVVIEGLGVIVHHRLHSLQHFKGNNASLQRLGSMEQQIQQLLQQLDLTCCPASLLQPGIPALARGSAQHYSTAFLISLFQPAWVSKVLSMSDEAIIGRLRELIRKMAVQLVQEGPQTASADQSNNNALSRAASVSGTSDTSCQSVQQQHCTGDSAAAELSAGAEQRRAMHPALEYACLMLSLMLWDEHRFGLLHTMNLETLQKDYVPPPEVWADVACKAEFTEEQVATLTCMHTLVERNVATLLQSIGDAARDGLAAAVLQEQQQQLMEYLPQTHQLLLHVQTSLLQQQSKDLAQWQLLSLQLGIVTMNTLTLRQMGLLQVLSYPGSPRIDLIMRAYRTLDKHQAPTGDQATGGQQS